MINMPLPSSNLPEENLYAVLMQCLTEIQRRAVDGTVSPLFVDYTNNRVLIGTTTASGSNQFQVLGSITIGGTVTASSGKYTGNVTASAFFGNSGNYSGNITASAFAGISGTYSGDITASAFYGDGSQLTSVSGTDIMAELMAFMGQA